MSGSEPGRATATMTVTADMVNRHGVCHGGIIFLLADAAMDYASNHEPDGIAYASHAEVDYAGPARIGDRLSATATASDRWGRTQLIDAVVTTGDGGVIAHFRGRTRTVRDR